MEGACVRPISGTNPGSEPLDSGKELEHTLRVPLVRPGRGVDDDTRGFDYFATDLHHLSVAIEIRRRFAEKRGFLLLSGPPAPDGELVQKYLESAKSSSDRRATRHRATLVECKPEWTFGDLIIACSRELGLGPDAGALKVLSQVQRELSKGVMRMLVLDNSDELEDDGFGDLHRFARMDGPPDVLPVVLLVTSRFAERLESDLVSLKPAIIGSLPMQRLLPGEVAAFIGYQVDPMGGRSGAAFAPETITAIAEAAQGDPRVVNRMMRQDLGLLQRSRGPTLAVPESVAEPVVAPAVPLGPVEGEAPPVTKAPVVETPAVETSVVKMPIADTPVVVTPIVVTLVGEAPVVEEPKELVPVSVPANDASRRSSMARLARGLTAAAAMLVVGLYAGAYLYLLMPGSVTVDAQRPIAPVAASLSTTPAPPIVVAAVESPSPAALARENTDTAAATGTSAPSAIPPAAIAAPAAEPTPAPPAAVETPAAAAAPVAATDPAASSPTPSPVDATDVVVAPTPAPDAPVAAASPSPAAASTPAAAPPASAPTTVAEAPAAALSPSSDVAYPPVAATPAPAPVADTLVVASPPSPAAAAAAPEARPQIAAIAPATPPRAEPPAAAPLPAAPAATREPAPASAASPLLTRADQLLALGDMSAAREFLELAADAGDAASATAAFRLGQTYDPLFLRQTAARGVAANPIKAALWYRQAADAGNREAAARLAALQGKAPGASAPVR
jgi:hypothetical protein